ncbi:DDE transposase [Mycobacteroides chelonae]|uniref:IS1595 family transposase n=1 Tax=Mycobacteroides chelonae TaxID=1774 RepID=UPI0008AA1D89|nr:IS1595 family transposase [Mycobacteroides chelonae]OHU10941.1 DDE transposase [Mycobacteroides chelonae]
MHPVGGADYPRTFQEFQRWFRDDRACLDYLAQLRWPNGFHCPACGCVDAWYTSKGQWKCQGCGRKTSVTAGTIFHRTRTPMTTWFAAIWFVTSQKNGVSAATLQQQFGFGSYETAWAWLHKLRRAMVRPDRDMLTGIVELDETFVGGRSKGKLGASTDKVPVMVAIERTDNGRLGRVRFNIAAAPGTVELVTFATEVIAPGSTVRTDGARVLRRLSALGYRHEFSSGYNSPDRDQELPGAHLVASLLKRWIAGTLQHNVSEKHLRYYLDEYAFRFNRRRSSARGLLFYRLLQQAVATDPHPLAELQLSR